MNEWKADVGQLFINSNENQKLKNDNYVIELGTEHLCTKIYIQSNAEISGDIVQK